jgi:hypothetical protein
MTTVWVGQDITVTLVATNDDDTPADPTGVRFWLKAPGDEATAFVLGQDDEVQAEGDGMTFTFTFDVPAPGRYDIRAETLNVGEVVAVAETVILVQRSAVL